MMHGNEIYKKFFSYYDRFLNFIMVIAGAIVVFQVLSVSFDVLMRFIFHKPILGVVGINEWSLVLLTFLGFGWLQRERGHVRMELVIERLSAKTQAIVGVLYRVLGILISIIFVWYGTIVTYDLFARGLSDHYKIRGVCIAWIVMFIPFGGGLLLIQLVRELYENITDLTKQLKR